MRLWLARCLCVLALALAPAACRRSAPADARVAEQSARGYGAFAHPEPVVVRGYDDHLMEPFLSRDGRWLFFNNRNEPPEKTDLHYAKRVNDLLFDYRGPVAGANSPALDGVPSMDRDGRFYFVSTRDYSRNFETLWRGRWADGKVTGVAPVPGISRHQARWVNFDAEISADGQTLYYVDGMLSWPLPGPPKVAKLAMARRQGETFVPLPQSAAWLAEVNTSALEYAPAISADELELFFTRLSQTEHGPALGIYRAARARIDAPFGTPERVTAIEGFVEAPTISPDGRSLYYHAKIEGRLVLRRVTR